MNLQGENYVRFFSLENSIARRKFSKEGAYDEHTELPRGYGETEALENSKKNTYFT